MKLHLYRRWEDGLVFKLAGAKIDQNFLAPKYGIKQHSDYLRIIWVIYNVFIK